MLVILLGAALLPVTIFAYLAPLLSDGVWLALLGVIVLILGGYLAYSVAVWLQAAATKDDHPGRIPSGFTAAAQAPPVDTSRGWNRWESLHVSHGSSRAGLFASLSIAIGISLQCAAVVLGPGYFEGPIDTGWQWPLLFGEQLFNTMLLGIPTGLVPTFAAIQPQGPMSQLLMTGIDIFYVAGVIAMAVLTLPSAFKLRELFSGTVRDLADYLENFDISGGQRLMIHRVAVLRPLDETEVVSLTKEAFVKKVSEGVG
jgi:hypothetical protein